MDSPAVAEMLRIPGLNDNTYITLTTGTTPTNYTQVFKNLVASVNHPSYLTYELRSSYDVQGCAAKCQTIAGCQAFNIFAERGPQVDPGPACSNPASVTNIKCTYFGANVTMAVYDEAGNLMDNCDVEIRRFHSIMAQIDDLEVEFDRIRHIRDIVRGYRQRVQEMERALESSQPSSSRHHHSSSSRHGHSSHGHSSSSHRHHHGHRRERH